MDTKKVIVTLLVLTIVFSILTIALNMLYGGREITILRKPVGVDKANVKLFVEGGEVAHVATTGNVGLYVEGE